MIVVENVANSIKCGKIEIPENDNKRLVLNLQKN
jgi:hypothetical protein